MRQRHRLTGTPRNDYWEARSRCARRTLAARKAAETALSILIVVVVRGAIAVIANGKAGGIGHRVEGPVGSAVGPAVGPEQEVEDSIN